MRIERRQQSYHHQPLEDRDDITFDGLVITRFSRHAHIEDVHGKTIHCSIRSNIDSIVAGDRVVWQAEGQRNGIILSIYPRKSVLGRPDQSGKIRPVAANITQIIIVVASQPSISWALLDSYLVMAEYLNIHACIILNKTDLDLDGLQQDLLKLYEPLGYPLLFTNHMEGDNKPLQKMLNNHTSVFVGQSGVGKSSLISRIMPNDTSIPTGSISEHSLLGCHTTSNSTLYHIPTGGDLIDSPGVREFGLWHMQPSEIARGYREFQGYISQCKFRNCNHLDSPACAVINAVKNKLISQKRYENYVKISAQFKK